MVLYFEKIIKKREIRGGFNCSKTPLVQNFSFLNFVAGY